MAGEVAKTVLWVQVPVSHVPTFVLPGASSGNLRTQLAVWRTAGLKGVKWKQWGSVFRTLSVSLLFLRGSPREVHDPVVPPAWVTYKEHLGGSQNHLRGLPFASCMIPS